MRQRSTQRRRHWQTSALLALLLFGAYIPAGFMPAAGTPFLLELCPVAGPLPMSADMDMDGAMAMPAHRDMRMDGAMSMPAHHHHGHPQHHGAHGQFETCPFGSAPAAGPLSSLDLVPNTVPVAALPEAPADAPLPARRAWRAHQPRGPPSPV